MTAHRELAARLIRKGEGLRLKVYDDATGRPIRAGDTLAGHATIGYGRNLAGKGISEAEADAMLAEDLIDAEEIARGYIGGEMWLALNEVRRAVLTDMAHNMGAHRLYGFTRLRLAIARQDWPKAGHEIEDSVYFRQVGSRGERNRDMMVTGATSEEWGE